MADRRDNKTEMLVDTHNKKYTLCRKSMKKPHMNKFSPQSWGMRECDFQSYNNIILKNASSQQKNYKTKRNRKYVPFTEGEKLTETIPEEAQTLDLLGMGIK